MRSPMNYRKSMASLMTRTLAVATIALSSGAVVDKANAQGLSNTTAGAIEVNKPLVILINEVPVPAQADGVLAEIPVEEGIIVEAGQTIAKMDDREARVTLELKQAEEIEAQLNALNDVNKRYAINAEELSREKSQAFKELLRKNAIAKWEARTAELEALRDNLQIELADLNQRIAEAQYKAKVSERQLAQLAVDKRLIIAPFAGFVEQRIAQPGEWLQAGAPIVKLVRMDTLRVQGFVEDARNTTRIATGMPVIVEFTLEDKSIERVPGKLGFVSNDIGLGGERRVWMDFENQRVGNDWKIRPGMKPTKMLITP